MRHGPAEDTAVSKADAHRALTAAGRERVRSVAKLLAENDEEPAEIVTSPLVRAVQTAEIAAIVTGLGARGGTVTVLSDLAPGGDAVALARRMASEGHKRVMLVGHEPDLSNMVAALLGKFDRPFEKGAVVGLHVPSGSAAARLRFVLDPKSLSFERPPGTAL